MQLKEGASHQCSLNDCIECALYQKVVHIIVTL